MRNTKLSGMGQRHRISGFQRGERNHGVRWGRRRLDRRHRHSHARLGAFRHGRARGTPKYRLRALIASRIERAATVARYSSTLAPERIASRHSASASAPLAVIVIRAIARARSATTAAGTGGGGDGSGRTGASGAGTDWGGALDDSAAVGFAETGSGISRAVI